MKVSDAQHKLFNKTEDDLADSINKALVEFQDKVIELAEEEVNHQELFDRLALVASWDCFPHDATIALVIGEETPIIIPRQQLEQIFNLDKSK